MIRIGLLSLLATGFATQSTALALIDCDRTTAVSHGGEADHVDLGEGRVMWRDWWSQEGTATNFVLVDCEPGRMLNVRAAETNMTRDRTGFDRAEDVLAVFELHESGSRVFATFERIAADLENIGEDIVIDVNETEFCACAALYPDLRGDKTAFALEDIRRAPWASNESEDQ